MGFGALISRLGRVGLRVVGIQVVGFRIEGFLLSVGYIAALNLNQLT